MVRDGVRSDPAGGSGLAQDPFPERLYFGPVPGGGGRGEATAFGRVDLALEQGDQRFAFQLLRDQHPASDGGPDPVHCGVDEHAVEAEGRGPRKVGRGFAPAGEPVLCQNSALLK